MKVSLEAVVGFVDRGQDRQRGGSPALVPNGSRALVPRKPVELTANDRRFLRSLRIAAEAVKVEEAN